jgi:hypothetical protein
MTEKTWQTIKVQFCHHVGCDAALEVEVIYPAEHLPESAPRITAHRCSLGGECNADNRASCQWAGTNPTLDPFA